MIRIRNMFLLVLCCPLLFLSSALGETGAAMTAESWSWSAEEATVLRGTVTVDGEDLSDAVWVLEVQTNDPEHPGTVVFTEINGASLNRRKRSDRVVAELSGGGAENTFTAEWYPDSESIGLNQATVRFRAENAGGAEIVSAVLTQGADNAAGDEPAGRLLSYVNQGVFILTVAAVVVWALALLRALLLRKRRA